MLILIGISLFPSCHRRDDFSLLKGPYLGQKPPGKDPQLFMPGFVSTTDLDICIAFLNSGKVCVFSNDENRIYFTYEKDGRWTQPEPVPWPDEQGKTQYTTGPDDRTLFFQSNRPVRVDHDRRDSSTCSVEWTGSGWTEPQLLPSPPNTDEYHEIYPSVTVNGTLYFFSGWRTEAPLGDIYRCMFVDGRYQTAEKLEYPVNSEYHELDPFATHDESYLIFASGRPGGFGFFDQYISFRGDDGAWMHPINMGSKFNSHPHVNTVGTTIDGKYIFFSSANPTEIPKGEKKESLLIDRIGDIDLYWVDSGVINDLKDEILGKKCAAETVEREYRENGLRAAIDKLTELYAGERENYHFFPSEFLIFCGHLVQAGNVTDAQEFYESLLNILPDEFRIKQGWVTVCLFNGLASKGLTQLRELWAQYPDSKSAQALEALTSCLNFLKKKDDELELLQFITQEFPDWYIAYYDLALAYSRLGDKKRAVENGKKSLKLKPGFADAQDLLNKLDAFPVLNGPYLGQRPPGSIPELFAPGIVSTNHSETCLNFSPDGKECYFNMAGLPFYVIVFMRQKEKAWIPPVIPPFSGRYNDWDFNLAPDGKRLYFTSHRPLSGEGGPSDNSDIWAVTRTDSGWSVPESLGPPVNTSGYEGHPSITRDGTLYYHHSKKEVENYDIYFSRLVNGRYVEPMKFADESGGDYDDYDPFIAPDESYIIFCSTDRSPKNAETNFFISFRRKDGSWTTAKNMGEKIKFRGSCPSVSPDGKYFFFTSYRPIKRTFSKIPISYEEKIKGIEATTSLGGIYWVDAKVIKDLRPKDNKLQ
jgi:tetratricopeptide (TPR) repeat protein